MSSVSPELLEGQELPEVRHPGEECREIERRAYESSFEE